MTKLNDAAFDGDIATAAKLIETYSKQKNKTRVFAEPLANAALMGHVEIVKLFLNAGADINYVREEGTTLHYAVRGMGMPAHLVGESLPNIEVVKVLIEAGADLSLTDDPKGMNFKGWTALMVATCYDRAAIAKVLVEAGSDINSRDQTGRTPLIIAANFSSVAVAEFLIQAGADIDAKDNRGLTAFDYVAKDIEVGTTEMEDELRPVQAFQQLLATPIGEPQTMIPQLFGLLSNAEELERVRCGRIARMLRSAGASGAV